jgi:hypothetical protein
VGFRPFKISTKTYLSYKAVAKAYDQMMTETEEETIFTDYREVDDIVVAYNLVIFERGGEDITLTIKDVKFNSGLEDFFSRWSRKAFWIKAWWAIQDLNL